MLEQLQQAAAGKVSNGFQLVDGVGWADFRDSVVVTVDRTLVEFVQSPELVRSLFERLASEARVDELEPLLPGVDAIELLTRLRGVGIVRGGDAALEESEFATPPVLAIPSHRALRVAVDADPDLRGRIEARIDESERSVVAAAEEADVTLVASESPARVAGASAECWRAGRTHVPLSAHDGRVVLIGPFAAPGHTACFDCLLLRRSGATTWPDAYWKLNHADELHRPWRDDRLGFAAAVAVRLAESTLVDDDGGVIGQVTTWDPRRMTLSASLLWSVPRCPTCSPLETYSTSYPWSEATPGEKAYWARSSGSRPEPAPSAAAPVSRAVRS